MMFQTKETLIHPDWKAIGKIIFGIVLVIGLTLVPYCNEAPPIEDVSEGGTPK